MSARAAKAYMTREGALVQAGLSYSCSHYIHELCDLHDLYGIHGQLDFYGNGPYDLHDKDLQYQCDILKEDLHDLDM